MGNSNELLYSGEGDGMDMMVNEIFLSIQGEGLLTGYPTVFVRFMGCNLRCSYCDTTYSYHEGKEISVEDIVDKIESYGYQRVCLTGGEPLIQKDLQDLLDALKGYRITIETNGSISLESFKLHSGQTFVMDVKTPSSGQHHMMCFSNLHKITNEDEIKFVIGNRQDYVWSKEIIDKHYNKGKITFSPVFGKIEPQVMVEWILEDRLDVRFGLQLHKIIFDPQRRGV